MDDRIRMKEVVSGARKKGITTSKTEIAEGILIDASNSHTALVCLNNIERGQTKSMTRIQVVATCKILDCTADQLFGVKPKIK
jgi:hypothetical protein